MSLPTSKGLCALCKQMTDVITFEVTPPIYVIACKPCIDQNPGILSVGTTIWKTCCG